jgi:hypothetical protein
VLSAIPLRHGLLQAAAEYTPATPAAIGSAVSAPHRPGMVDGVDEIGIFVVRDVFAAWAFQQGDVHRPNSGKKYEPKDCYTSTGKAILALIEQDQFMPNSSPMATLRRSFAIQQSMSALEQRVMQLNLNGDPEHQDALQTAQTALLETLVVVDRECQGDAALKEFARKHLTQPCCYLGLMWHSCRISEDINSDSAIEFSSVLTTAFEAFGVPVEGLNFHNFIGIHDSLDKIIVDSVIKYYIASHTLSVSYFDTYSEYQSEHEQAFWHLNTLTSSLGSASSVKSYLDILESLVFLNAQDKDSWLAMPLIRLGLSFFNQPAVLSEDDKNQIRGYFSALLPQVENFADFVDIHGQLVSMCRSGLSDVAEPLITSTFYSQRGYSQSTQLIDIETYTTLDVAPMLYHFVREHVDGKALGINYFDVIVTYQLLSKREDIQFDLLDFKAGEHHGIESIVVNERQGFFNSDEYEVQNKSLRKLLQEYLAQHPKYLNEMSENPSFGALVKGMEIWDVHRLETDLGL